MPKRVQRLEAITHQHHLAVSSPLVVKKPPSEKSAKLQNNNSVVCLLVLVHWCTCASVGTLRRVSFKAGISSECSTRILCTKISCRGGWTRSCDIRA